MQETRIWYLVWEDLKSRRATKPVHHNYWEPGGHNYWEPGGHNYWEPGSRNCWAHVPRAYGLQQEKLVQWEIQALQQRVTPALCTWKKAHSQQRSPSTT